MKKEPESKIKVMNAAGLCWQLFNSGCCVQINKTIIYIIYKIGGGDNQPCLRVCHGWGLGGGVCARGGVMIFLMILTRFTIKCRLRGVCVWHFYR